MRFLVPAPILPVALMPAALFLASCSAADLPGEDLAVAPILTSEEARDEFTYARPMEARVTHVALDLVLDFEGKRVDGSAALDIEAAPDAAEIVLDTDGLIIGGVTDGAGNELAWKLGESDPEMGEPLTVSFTQVDDGGADGVVAAPETIIITYASGPEAEALQWLSPQQTAGGTYPFVFSQGQSILNRTWIPTQDSPGIRQSWEARITAPEPLTVVMSGISRGDPEALDGGQNVFEFTMENSVPSYLIALAAGDIAFADLGPRSGVWAEPSMLEAATAELSDTEAMIDAAEGLYGDYRWGRYDMIVLPPAFPYGGMENPVMTFLTPTFIAGDRSNTGLIAHELAHSWSGNLVTYASWRDGWLNEGVTSYLENRISEVVFGEQRAEQEYALSFAALEEMVADMGADNPVTAMRTPAGTSPFETAGEAIYDKGTVFLRTMETFIGREKFDTWLRGWFDRHAFQPATSEMFLADLRENLISGDGELEQSLMLDEWVYGVGLPENAVRPDPAAFAAVDGAALAYGETATIPAAAWAAWTTAERLRFLHEIPEAMSDTQLAALDDALGLSTSGNNEVVFLWLEAGLRNQYAPVVPQAERFLARVGRNKFVEPLFKVLSEQGAWGTAIARPLYARTRPGYHAYTRGQVDPVMGYETDRESAESPIS